MRQRHVGFTLVELMIVVAIVAILAAIAIPAYQQYVIDSRRGAAKACLAELAQWMERYNSTNFRYTTAVGSATAPAVPALECVGNALQYQFTFLAPSDQTYTVTATPQGGQATNDKKCGRSLTLDNSGNKGVTGSGSATVQVCW
ncbi:MAG: prepilin-type N-terminal cleavage/methylation domain-containing protein [Proteobacteria bacterium]|nr:MAG: prepilin-type N-terminal cleavage/methylation domain-containing protein [Pseudomonadota bacterium]